MTLPNRSYKSYEWKSVSLENSVVPGTGFSAQRSNLVLPKSRDSFIPIHGSEMQPLLSVSDLWASHLVTPTSCSELILFLRSFLLLDPNTASKHARSTEIKLMLFLIQLNTLLKLLLERLWRQIPEDLKNSVTNRKAR